jgi:hypothetical protein
MTEKPVRILLVAGAVVAALLAGRAALPPSKPSSDGSTPAAVPLPAADRVRVSTPLAPFAEKGLGWLAEAQHASGGWGGGSHAAQQVRDPHAVVTDPGTTAFAAMAFLRAGHTPKSGKYKDTVARALEHLLAIVESAPDDGPRITNVTGTQPQAKMGPDVDTALCSQFLSRVLPEVKGEAALEKRVAKAIDKCVAKIQKAQTKEGNWSAGGWAPVLQSSLMNSSLEMAQAAARPVDAGVLTKSRDFQKRQVDEVQQTVATGTAAGVALYAMSSNLRAGAMEAEAADRIIDDAKKGGRLAPESRVSVENLIVAGVEKDQAEKLGKAYAQTQFVGSRMDDESVLAGFGSNGGEEFLSYLQRSEALLIAKSADFETWNGKMSERLTKIQNQDGSWSGHHCITSPVFCTAAVILTIAADRDADLLRETAKFAGK